MPNPFHTMEALLNTAFRMFGTAIEITNDSGPIKCFSALVLTVEVQRSKVLLYFKKFFFFHNTDMDSLIPKNPNVYM